jgi:hypothetical protein
MKPYMRFFGAQLRDVFATMSFVRLSPAGNSLYRCQDCYFFSSSPL